MELLRIYDTIKIKRLCYFKKKKHESKIKRLQKHELALKKKKKKFHCVIKKDYALVPSKIPPILDGATLWARSRRGRRNGRQWKVPARARRISGLILCKFDVLCYTRCV